MKTRHEIESQMVEVSIEIPSGLLAYSDSLDDGFNITEDFDVNRISGIKKTIEAYEKKGVFHGFCGNTCPSVYYKDDKIIIGSLSEDHPFYNFNVGSIMTNLWWYSFADKTTYIKNGGRKTIEFIKVKPGRYLLRHQLNGRWVETPDQKNVIYATIELSNKKPKKFGLPEDEIEKKMKKLLSPKEKKDKSFHYWAKPNNETKREDFIGYSIGMMGQNSISTITLTEDQFNQDPEKIINDIRNDLKRQEERHAKLEKEKKEGKIPSLSKQTKNKIRKMLKL